MGRGLSSCRYSMPLAMSAAILNSCESDIGVLAMTSDRLPRAASSVTIAGPRKLLVVVMAPRNCGGVGGAVHHSS